MRTGKENRLSAMTTGNDLMAALPAYVSDQLSAMTGAIVE